MKLIHFFFFFFISFLYHPLSISTEASRFRTLILINATEFPPEEYFDYIVVGGGTAGCPLAATLSQAFRVLVLERGGVPYADAAAMSQDGFLTSLASASASDAGETSAQAFVSDDGVPNARGRVLGGSSAVNAGFYTRADEEFYEKSGVAWDRRLANESFEWVESKIVFRPELKPWQLSFRDGLLQAGLKPYNGYTVEHLVGTKIGGSIFDRRGKRHSASDLLFHGRPENTKVAVHATVEKILISTQTASSQAGRATGVMFRDRAGKRHRAMIRRKGEVLITAGAMGSPQLMLLSGVGPRSYLSAWRIPVTRDSPNVGKFFFDNPRNSVSIVAPPVPLEHSLIQVVGITASGAYLEASSTGIPFLVPAGTSGFLQVQEAGPVMLTVVTIMSKISGPASVGTYRLVSRDVGVSPVVKFNYFKHPDDVEKCVNGTRAIAAVLMSPALERLKFSAPGGRRKEFRFVGPAVPAETWKYEAVADFCRRTVSSIWHYHGGCLVGKVVDSHHRVFGVSSLRIVDGSTFPVSPGTNPQATVMMLGRYVGVKILRERIGYS